MSGRKISAEGFTSGILWHALRQEANQPPPQDRYHQGWIRFTEQLAICVSDDGGRDGRSLASSNGPQNLQGSIEIRDLKPGEKISVGKRIYKAALFDKDPFYRVKGENCYEQKRSARTGNRRSYLWLRKGFDLPMLPLDDSGLGELEHSGGGKHGTPQERDMIEEILEPENIALAWKRVKANKGAPGIDGMAVADFLAFAQEHWPKIASAIREGTYRPAPVRRVWITTPVGSKRPLGIPTVLDRVVQQAVTQVLGPLFEAGFSEHNEFDNENEED
jgi:hypothetical protein